MTKNYIFNKMLLSGSVIFTCILIGALFVSLQICLCEDVKSMPKEERVQLREEARDMFYHAYNAYMENAYPADELMPLSCTGRYRGVSANRGDIDDSMGKLRLDDFAVPGPSQLLQ